MENGKKEQDHQDPEKLKETDKLGVVPKEEIKGSDADPDRTMADPDTWAEQNKGSDAAADRKTQQEP